MDKSLRLPLSQGFEPRNVNVDTDDLSANIIFEGSKNEKTYAIRRPGLSTVIGALGQPTGYYSHQGDPSYYVPWQGTFGAFTYGDMFFGLGPPPPYKWVGNYINSQFVAIGQDPALGFAEYIICSSTNGTSWTYKSRISLPGAQYLKPQQILWNGTTYLLIAQYNAVVPNSQRFYTSTDLVTWVDRGFGTGTGRPGGTPVDVFGSTFYTLGGSGFATSTNGYDWSASTLFSPASFYNARQSINDGTSVKSFATDFAGTSKLVISTTNLTNWTSAGTSGATPVNPLTGTNGNFGAFLNAKYLCSFLRAVYVSTNSTTWTNTGVTGNFGNLKPVYTGTTYIITETNGSVYLSTDTTTWTRKKILTVPNSQISSVASNGAGTVVMFATNNSGAGLWGGAVSTDHGATWNESKLPTYFNPLPGQSAF